MPDDKHELVIEVKTNAADAAQDIEKLSGAVDNLGETQSKEAAREKDANAERTRAAGNLRQILETMLAQLNSVSAASTRTASTAEKAFKKVAAYERAIRKEKQISDREEAKRQSDAKENFKAEQSRTQDRLQGLKLLAAGGAILGIGKMALNAAATSARRGMSLINAKKLTGLDADYLRGVGNAVELQGGTKEMANGALVGLSQKLFRLWRGHENIDPMAAQLLPGAPWMSNNAQHFMEYLADKLPQLSPQEAMAAGGTMGLPEEVIAALIEAGSAENWRKMIAQGAKNTAPDEKSAKGAQAVLTNLANGAARIPQAGAEVLSKVNEALTPEEQQAAGVYMGVSGALAGLKVLSPLLTKLPFLGKMLSFLGGLPLFTSYQVYETFKEGHRDIERGPAQKETGDKRTPDEIVEEWIVKKIKAFLERFTSGYQHYGAPDESGGYFFNPQGVNLRQFEDMIRLNPFNFMGGQAYYNYLHGGSAPGNTDNSREVAVTFEGGIHITAPGNDPQSIANAAQDALGAAALRLIDRHTAGVYTV